MLLNKIFICGILFFLNSDVLFAQKYQPDLTKQDSTLKHYLIILDSLLVTPENPTFLLEQQRRSLTHGNAAIRFAEEANLTSAIPGVTADLDRDLPGLITFYAANGIPILTKKSQNHSLTPTMSYAVIKPKLSEPNARKSSPDAIVTLTPSYSSTKNVILDPLHQGASFATGDQKLFSIALVGEHSSPTLLEDYIKELSAYAKTYSGLVSARIKTDRSSLEVTGQHQYSDNEFGAIFDVLHFQEQDYLSMVFASATHKIGFLLVEGGYGFQQAEVNTEFDELYIDAFNATQKLLAQTYKFALQVKNTSLEGFYHDVQRTLTHSASEVQNVQLIFTHEQAFTSFFHAVVSGRVDHHDEITEPSMSVQLIFAPARFLLLEGSVAHLYDPINSLAMNSSIYDANGYRTGPTTTNYASFKASYSPLGWELKTNAIYRNISKYWYRQLSEIEGFVAGASIKRTFTSGEEILAIRLNVRKRWMNLTIDERDPVQMPGPPPLQAGLRTEYGSKRIGISIDTQLHLYRTQAVSEDLIVPMGDLLLLNLGLTTKMGPVSMGATVGNTLGNFRDNKLFAYERRVNNSEREVDFIAAPFIPGISLSIDF